MRPRDGFAKGDNSGEGPEDVVVRSMPCFPLLPRISLSSIGPTKNSAEPILSERSAADDSPRFQEARFY